MNPAPLTSFYAAILALLFVVLSLRVIGQRRKSGVSLGLANNGVLERVARVHANFAEYVPLALTLLLLAELGHYPSLIVHSLGLALVFGRLVHAFGVSRVPEDFRLRMIGMMATFGVIITLSAALLLRPLLRLP